AAERHPSKPAARRRVWLGVWVEIAVHRMDALATGQEVKGPAIFESATTTVLVREGERVTVTPNGWRDIRLRWARETGGAPQRGGARRRLRAVHRRARVRLPVHDPAGVRGLPGRAQRRHRRDPRGDDARLVPAVPVRGRVHRVARAETPVRPALHGLGAGAV